MYVLILTIMLRIMHTTRNLHVYFKILYAYKYENMWRNKKKNMRAQKQRKSVKFLAITIKHFA